MLSLRASKKQEGDALRAREEYVRAIRARANVQLAKLLRKGVAKIYKKHTYAFYIKKTCFYNVSMCILSSKDYIKGSMPELVKRDGL